MEDTPIHPRLQRAGDSAWLVNFGERTDDAVNNAALAFDRWLTGEAVSGIVETAPTIRSVLVRFDPLELDDERLRALLEDALTGRDWLAAPPPEGRRRWHVPVAYGGGHGPHLEAIAAERGLDAASLVADHGAAPQRVRMIGFAPGFLYTGTLGAGWDLPRRNELSPAVPPGTLAVAVRQTVLTSTTVPTGWHLIGRSPWRPFQVDRTPPFTVAAGDEVVFAAVDETLYADLDAAAAAGETVARAEELP